MERQFTVNDFVSAFEETCHGQHPQSVFRDWAEVTALSIANLMDPFQESEEWKNREDQYLAIAKKYRPETINLFSDLLGMLTMMFDDHIEDYLGKIYMDLGGNSQYLAIAKKYRPETINLFSDLLGMLTMMFDDHIEDYLGKIYMDLGGNSKTGQFFTPWHLAKMTAAPVLLGMLTMMFDDHIEDYLGKIYMDLGGNSKTGQFFTPWHLAKMTAAPVAGAGEEVEFIEEPSCGSGSMILGMAASLADKGINYQNVMKVTAHDLDSLCVHMCYIQLSLTGIRAKVIQGNTLALADKGINYQNVMKVTAHDLDSLCVHMCYIQLSLTGIRAKVIQGNTLANEVVKVWYTPSYIWAGDRF